MLRSSLMATVQIRDVPDDVQAILKRRADAAGVSLAQYLRDMLTRVARRPTIEELDRLVAQDAESEPSAEAIVAEVRKLRDDAA